MSAEDEHDAKTPTETALALHLELLRETPEPPTALTERVIRTARWQQAVRSPLLTIAHLTAAATDAVRLLLGGRA